jgi:hypothetical protein
MVSHQHDLNKTAIMQFELRISMAASNLLSDVQRGKMNFQGCIVCAELYGISNTPTIIFCLSVPADQGQGRSSPDKVSGSLNPFNNITHFMD